MSEAQRYREAQTRGSIPCRCLVLAGAVGGVPADLSRALASRGMAVEAVHDEPSAMLALAPQDNPPGVFVVVDPVCWGRLGELSYALRRYHPKLLCWQYRAGEGGVPRLTTLDQTVPGPSNGLSGEEGADCGPIGKIVGRRRAVDELLVRVPGQPLTSSEIVTQQELTMLLGPTPGEAG